MRKVYQKPAISSEKMFEQAALGCATSYLPDPDCYAKENNVACRGMHIKS
ncbi:MAG: hypothetical protein AB1414_07530 [bacterium]